MSTRSVTNAAGPELLTALASWSARIEHVCGPVAAQRYVSLMLDTWQTTMSWDNDRVFVITGDIPAMWLRDSSAQVLPFLRLTGVDEVRQTIHGVMRQQWSCIMTDPYANAFNPGPTGAHFDSNDLDLAPYVWERKYEIDSLAFPIQLAYRFWRCTRSGDHLDELVHDGCVAIVDQWSLEQDHALSPYRHVRPGEPADTLALNGRGGPVAVTGMTWSGFRPSDDKCEFGYNIPAQLMAATSLRQVAIMAREVWNDAALAQHSLILAEEITKGVNRFGIRDGRYLYEVDGLGGELEMDDANMPSLLSLPLISDLRADDPRYLKTRRWVLSQANPYYYTGHRAKGIGSPHTPPGYVWHIALAVEGLTGTFEDGIRCLETILATDGGTGMTHESFDPNRPEVFTRPWFSWSNAMACELMMSLAARRD